MQRVKMVKQTGYILLFQLIKIWPLLFVRSVGAFQGIEGFFPIKLNNSIGSIKLKTV